MTAFCLRPIAPADLPLVDQWFREAETRRWLGGPGWAKKGLKLVGPKRHHLLGLLDEVPIGLTDVEIEDDRRASFAIAIDPARRRQGLGRLMTEAILTDARLDGVVQLYAGVETNNLASRRLLESCGFHQLGPEDTDGFVYYGRDRTSDGDISVS